MIRRGLLGAADGATDVVSVQPGCKLAELVSDSEQATQIWGLRQISQHFMIDSSSELEVIMTKGYPGFNLATAAKTGIRAQEAHWEPGGCTARRLLRLGLGFGSINA
jgi:hypothetical protein